MNWVDAAEIMSGLGTMGALIFVAFQTLYSNRALAQARELMELERDRDQREQMEGAKKAAEGVGSWPVILRRGSGKGEWGLEIVNPSSAPVYEVKVVRAAGQAASGALVEEIAARAAVLAPGRYFAGDGPFLEWLQSDAQTEPIMGGRRYRATLTFTDTNGREWMRDPDGLLTETTTGLDPLPHPLEDAATQAK
ncbi:hypothetical protein [Arthrobacter sunyaminii]|uniref:hypothetical protein n=1 Tax=Arthrobacter sunyaminii TaxID=2816859 RepID=UPI001A953AE2|nr:hypothetical protein [Arthrobacter sunyaminii]MBO0896143.1 hypothetical protein [Arthrobacter sunyaminii]